MKTYQGNTVLGLALIGGGLLLLLRNLGILGSAAGLTWSLLFALGGLIFSTVFISNRRHWWALIPGFVLLGLTLVTGVNALWPQAEGGWTGGLFLGMIGLGFFAVYFAERANWWAIIPAGTLLTLAAIASMPGHPGVPGLLCLGLAATFGLVYALPAPHGRNTWAAIPALVLLVLGSLMSVRALPGWNYIWPGLLIATGLYQLVRSLNSSRSR